MPMTTRPRAARITHDHLWSVCERLPEDYEPYGKEKDRRSDCGSGCSWWVPLSGAHYGDWGVCVNPQSHRVSLLTFEHQGCHHARIL